MAGQSNGETDAETDTATAMSFGYIPKLTKWSPFHGSAWAVTQSLAKLAALPDDTAVYCGHEYTQSNARFALTVDPENARLKARTVEIAALRAAGKPTVPTTLARELAANPFLRADKPDMQARWGGGDAVATFAALRSAKDNF